MGRFAKAGIEKIKIPLSADELSEEKIIAYFPKILAVHRRNMRKIKYYSDFVDGSYQDVDDKRRKFSEDNNNIIKQNHAHALVSFKEGFLLGDKREFAPKIDEDSSGLIQLDRFLDDVSFYSKDLAVKHNVYATGIATSFVQPRTDILVSLENGGARYKEESEGYSPKDDSPFVYECVDSRYNAVVYTSKVGQSVNSLFCFNISRELDEVGKERDVYTIFTRDYTFKLDSSLTVIQSAVETPAFFKELPMVEHSLNENRIGIVEVVNDPLNAINTLLSNGVDNVVDAVNQILVFTGCEIDQQTLTAGLRDGALSLPTTGPVSPDVKRISVDLKFSDLEVLIKEILTRLYEIVGVPLAGIGGGGNNGAAYISGGWTNALTVIKRDVLAFESSDRELLHKFLAIAENTPYTGIFGIKENDVEIKYNVNITDNILSNSQAIQNLVDVNMPFEQILKAVPITSDIKTVAARWQANVDRLKAESAETEAKAEATIGFEANLNS